MSEALYMWELGQADGKYQERERIIALLDGEHSEFTHQHQENKRAFIDDCAACSAISLIKGENE